MQNIIVKKTLSRRQAMQGSAGLLAVAVVPLRARLAVAQASAAVDPAALEWGAAPGRARWRVEGPAKVRGEKQFARDLRVADLAGWPSDCLHAKFVGATRVDRVFTGLNLGRLPADAQPEQVVVGPPELRPVAAGQRDVLLDETTEIWIASGFAFPAAKADPLVVAPGAQAAFYGQPVGFLMFRDPFALRRAAEAIRFDDQFIGWGDARPPPAPHVLWPETLYVRASEPGQAIDSFSFAQDGPRQEKDVEAYVKRAKAAAAQVRSLLARGSGLPPIESSLTTSAQDPFFMEAEAGLGWFDPGSGMLRLVLGTQSPDHDAAAVAEMLKDYPGQRPLGVEIISCFPGGGFGGRDQSPFSLYLALLAMLAAGTPVRLAYDRFDQFQAGLKRQASSLRGKLQVDNAGRILALEADLKFDAGGRGNLSPYVAAVGALAAGGAYDVPVRHRQRERPRLGGSAGRLAARFRRSRGLPHHRDLAGHGRSAGRRRPDRVPQAEPAAA